MKKETDVYYRCEICNNRHATEQAAWDCENQGKPDVGPHLVGLIFGDNRPDAFYEDCVFALPPKYATDEMIVSGHYLDSSFWACRDNGAGDSLGREFCGGNFLVFEPDQMSHIDIEMPAFNRMVNYLRSKEIIPKLMMLDGEIREI